MNERIKELADQCRGDAMKSAFEPLLDKEKFAELIVKECIDYCGENLSKTVGVALKMHFGIKE